MYKIKGASGEQRTQRGRIAVLATDAFEKVELTIPVAALRSAGAKVDIVSLHPGSIRGVNLHKPANKVDVKLFRKQTRPTMTPCVFPADLLILTCCASRPKRAILFALSISPTSRSHRYATDRGCWRLRDF
jgi:hypothetical protein